MRGGGKRKGNEDGKGRGNKRMRCREGNLYKREPLKEKDEEGKKRIYGAGRKVV